MKEDKLYAYPHYVQSGSQYFLVTKPDEIKIYALDIESDYDVIGSICVDVVANGTSSVNYLKKKAAKLGANAIIHVELKKIDTYSQRTGISGVAVRTK